MAQRCIDTLAGTGATIAIIPAGTANLLASNLGIPTDIAGAVMTGLHGRRRRHRRRAHERRAVRGDGRRGLRRRHDQAARRRPEGPARPRSLRLDRRQEPPRLRRSRRRSESTAALVQAARRAAFSPATSAPCSAACRSSRMPSRTTACSISPSSPPTGSCSGRAPCGRTIAGHPERSPFVRVTKAPKVKVKLDRKVLYELDGGARTKVKAYRAGGRARSDHRVRPHRPRIELKAEDP